MSATVTLSTTTLSQTVPSASQRFIVVASTSGLSKGIRLFVDRELMSVVSLGVNNRVNVQRGVDGTSATPHSSSAVIVIGTGIQFYQNDPQGQPPASPEVSPWINLSNGSVWYLQGNETDDNRWWQKRTTIYDVGALGVRTQVNDIP